MYSYDFYIEHPEHSLITYQNKPFLEKGASKPKPPPPVIAPVDASTASGDQEAILASKSRKGLRSTILAQNSQSLAPSVGGVTKLGSTPTMTLGTLAK